jgi:SPP1 family predicted phage head-tail adaptor
MLLGGAVNAGLLDRRVWIDKRTTVQDSSGDPVVSWEPLLEVWARIVPLTGREDDVDNDIMAEVDTRIRLRYSPVTAALSPAVDRLRYGERIYNIVSAIDVNTEHVEMLINAKSGLNDG